MKKTYVNTFDVPFLGFKEHMFIWLLSPKLRNQSHQKKAVAKINLILDLLDSSISVQG